MTKLSLLAAVALVFVGCKKADLGSDKGKVSYAIGHQVARNFKSQNVDIDIKAFSQAFEDVFAGKEPSISEEEMRAALRKFSEAKNKEMQEKIADQKKQGEANIKIGEDFLKANLKKEGVKQTKSGLQYKVLVAGKGKKPKETDTVEVHYRGRLINGKEFDSSHERGQPAKFPVNGLIKGWIEALQMMTEGSTWEIYVPSDLAYGEAGAGADIAPNSVLIFEMQLIKIVK